MIVDYKMDKVRHNGIKDQLGGAVTEEEFDDGVAVTLTNPLRALSKRALRLELQALAYLAIKTNRSLIIPNALVGVKSNVKGQKTFECELENPRSAYCHQGGGVDKKLEVQIIIKSIISLQQQQEE